MKKLFLFLSCFCLLSSFDANAAAIQYIGNGKGGPIIKITYSRSNGAKWETKTLKPGQVFSIPKDATHLRIDNAPMNPKRNYKVRDGNVF